MRSSRFLRIFTVLCLCVANFRRVLQREICGCFTVQIQVRCPLCCVWHRNDVDTPGERSLSPGPSYAVSPGLRHWIVWKGWPICQVSFMCLNGKPDCVSTDCCRYQKFANMLTIILRFHKCSTCRRRDTSNRERCFGNWSFLQSTF